MHARVCVCTYSPLGVVDVVVTFVGIIIPVLRGMEWMVEVYVTFTSKTRSLSVHTYILSCLCGSNC